MYVYLDRRVNLAYHLGSDQGGRKRAVGGGGGVIAFKSIGKDEECPAPSIQESTAYQKLIYISQETCVSLPSDSQRDLYGLTGHLTSKGLAGHLTSSQQAVHNSD